jgi:hypothetical protein
MSNLLRRSDPPPATGTRDADDGSSKIGSVTTEQELEAFTCDDNDSMTKWGLELLRDIEWAESVNVAGDATHEHTDRVTLRAL